MNEHRKEKNNEEEDNGYKRNKLQMIKENKKENDIKEIKNLKTGINNNSLEMKKRKIIALRRSYNKEINHDEFQKDGIFRKRNDEKRSCRKAYDNAALRTRQQEIARMVRGKQKKRRVYFAYGAVYSFRKRRWLSRA